MGKVFFSYSRADSDVATKLARELSAARVELWIDKREIRNHWDNDIEEAIQSCSALLVVLTPESAKSENVRDEISYALSCGKTVVPVMLEKCKLPFRIHRLHYEDFTEDYAAALARCCERLGAGAPAQKARKAQVRKPQARDTSASAGSSTLPAPEGAATFRELEHAPEMTRIEPGEFSMGAPPGEKNAGKDELPQHPVVIARAFAIGRCAVTFSEWAAALADHGVEHTPRDSGWGAGNRPVIDVSWDDAQSYLRWLSRKSGGTYRLPTEAEWEYVARAGTTTPFWWGSAITAADANFDARYPYEGAAPAEARKRTEPVDAFKPNPWGLYQVHGNVWEWCQDGWSDSHQGALPDGSAREPVDAPLRFAFLSLPTTPRRVVRGGSWKSVPTDLRSSRRTSFPQYYRSNAIGFRVARDL